MSATRPIAVSQAHQALQAVAVLQPLELVNGESLQLALEFGGMYPPSASCREHGAALQFRQGMSFEDALSTALNNIRGAHGVAMHMQSADGDELTRRSACALVALLEVAGGAVSLVQSALHRVEAQARSEVAK